MVESPAGWCRAILCEWWGLPYRAYLWCMIAWCSCRTQIKDQNVAAHGTGDTLLGLLEIYIYAPVASLGTTFLSWYPWKHWVLECVGGASGGGSFLVFCFVLHDLERGYMDMENWRHGLALLCNWFPSLDYYLMERSWRSCFHERLGHLDPRPVPLCTPKCSTEPGWGPSGPLVRGARQPWLPADQWVREVLPVSQMPRSHHGPRPLSAPWGYLQPRHDAVRGGSRAGGEGVALLGDLPDRWVS